MSDIEFDYDYLKQRALKRVLFDVLSVTAELKHTPGEHHFYIEFETTAPGVDIPDHLREAYPEAMAIVIQHQFDALEVDEEGFAVTLWFKGKPARLTVPFEAVTSFADPSVPFRLLFSGINLPLAKTDEKPETASPADAAKEGEGKEEPGAEVVSLDSFRKK